MNDQLFQNIKKLVRDDDAIEVPQSTLKKAYDIFNPASCHMPVFSLRRLVLSGANLRKAGISEKVLYEFDDDRFLQLSLSEKTHGFNVHGFLSDFAPDTITIYTDDGELVSDCSSGDFSFECLPEGIYNLMFEDGGQRFWVRNLELKKKMSTDKDL